MASDTIVIDNGGWHLKAGWAGQAAPACIVPNTTARIKRQQRLLVADETETKIKDLSQLVYVRPIERGYVTDTFTQSLIWDRVLGHSLLGVKDVRSKRLLLTTPPFVPEAIERELDEHLFETVGVAALCRAPAAQLAAYSLLYDGAAALPFAASGCGVVIDAGFSATHIVPFYNFAPLPGAIRRLDVGGKLLTNLLKEQVSFRQWNMMDAGAVVNAVKERLCFVALAFDVELEIARRLAAPGAIARATQARNSLLQQAEAHSAAAGGVGASGERATRLRRLPSECASSSSGPLSASSALSRGGSSNRHNTTNNGGACAGSFARARPTEDGVGVGCRREYVLPDHARIHGLGFVRGSEEDPAMILQRRGGGGGGGGGPGGGSAEASAGAAGAGDAGAVLSSALRKRPSGGLLPLDGDDSPDAASVAGGGAAAAAARRDIGPAAGHRRRGSNKAAGSSSSSGGGGAAAAVDRDDSAGRNARDDSDTDADSMSSSGSSEGASGRLAESDSDGGSGGRAAKRARRDEGASSTARRRRRRAEELRGASGVSLARGPSSAGVDDDGDGDGADAASGRAAVSSSSSSSAAVAAEEAAAEDDDETAALAAAAGVPEEELQLLAMHAERFAVPEALFAPGTVGLAQRGLHAAVAEAIAAAPAALRPGLWSSILLTGGGARLPGLEARLAAELRALAPAHVPLRLHTPAEPALAAWRGGSLWAAGGAHSRLQAPLLLPAFAACCVSRAQYLEEGAHRRHRLEGQRAFRLADPWAPVAGVPPPPPEQQTAAAAAAADELPGTSRGVARWGNSKGAAAAATAASMAAGAALAGAAGSGLLSRATSSQASAGSSSGAGPAAVAAAAAVGGGRRRGGPVSYAEANEDDEF